MGTARRAPTMNAIPAVGAQRAVP